jgi:hypothetical protein
MNKMDSLMKILEDKNKDSSSIKEIFTESIQEQVSEARRGNQEVRSKR